MKARFSAPVYTGPGTHPASRTMSTGSFSGIESGRDVALTPHPFLVPWSKEQSRAIPLLSLRAFVACKKCETYIYVLDFKLSLCSVLTVSVFGCIPSV
jgi:hypothetical protein